ncbi:hypothetical protein BBOR36S_04223 [Brevibacillus borstelensis]
MSKATIRSPESFSSLLYNQCTDVAAVRYAHVCSHAGFAALRPLGWREMIVFLAGGTQVSKETLFPPLFRGDRNTGVYGRLKM